MTPQGLHARARAQVPQLDAAVARACQQPCRARGLPRGRRVDGPAAAQAAGASVASAAGDAGTGAAAGAGRAVGLDGQLRCCDAAAEDGSPAVRWRACGSAICSGRAKRVAAGGGGRLAGGLAAFGQGVGRNSDHAHDGTEMLLCTAARCSQTDTHNTVSSGYTHLEQSQGNPYLECRLAPP